MMEPGSKRTLFRTFIVHPYMFYHRIVKAIKRLANNTGIKWKNFKWDLSAEAREIAHERDAKAFRERWPILMSHRNGDNIYPGWHEFNQTAGWDRRNGLLGFLTVEDAVAFKLAHADDIDFGDGE